MITMLHVLETLKGDGGTPRKLLYLARHIDRQQVKLVFAHFRPSPLAHEFIESGCQVHAIHTESPLALTWQIQEIAQKSRANIICTHFTRALLTGFVVAKWCHIPIIHNEHSSAHYRQGLGRTLARLVLPWVDLIICNSEHTRQSIQKSFWGTKDKLVTVHNPVEERTAGRSVKEVRAELGVAANEILIMHVGRMISERDQLTILKGVYELRKTFSSVRLVMIGEGPQRAALELSARMMGLEGSVIFLGNSNEIGDYLEAADIYVNSTLDEGFGIAVVEAMLSRVPVVLSDRGAHPELIVSGKSGLLYEGGNSHALAAKLGLLVGDPDMRRRMGSEGRRHAQRRFAPADYATRYLDFITPKVSRYS